MTDQEIIEEIRKAEIDLSVYGNATLSIDSIRKSVRAMRAEDMLKPRPKVVSRTVYEWMQSQGMPLEGVFMTRDKLG